MKATMGTGIIEYLKESNIQNFDTAFCQAVGWIGADAERNPEMLCEIREIQALFIYLFELRQKQHQTQED